MIYCDFQNLQLSMLGLGAMRLPCLPDQSIDVEQTRAMVDYALKNGINYFDTAYPYHQGKSETVMGEILSAYPRDSYYLASKYPGHQIMSEYDPKGLFEEQLKKCRVDYFDFYLLHNVCENSYDTYMDPKWGIIDYFLEQRRLGRIRHLGFSSHANPETLRRFLQQYGKEMEFCQIQLNYLDWSLQKGEEKVQILNEFNVPIWVMEPVRGGKLAALRPEQMQPLQAIQPDWTACDWTFRFLEGVPGVSVILSGMSNMEQLVQNVKTFEEKRSLTEAEEKTLLAVSESMKNDLPCTGCRYCTEGCPMGLQIPTLIAYLNELRFDEKAGNTVTMYLESLPEEQLPSACIGCGACAAICPQKIDIPQAMQDLTDLASRLPSWASICREREAIARKNAGL